MESSSAVAEVETTSEPKKLAKGWGLEPAEGVTFHWSARAIFQDCIDLLHDRQGLEGVTSEEERDKLQTWINDKGLPVLRSMYNSDTGNFPYPSENREIEVKGDGYRLRANPRASYGYLYLSAAPDPTATEPTPKPLKKKAPPKPRLRRKPAKRFP
jgi:hypothetical protein